MSEPQQITVPALVTIPSVDIMAAGEWKLSTGPATFTPEDLANAVEAAQCPAIGDPVLKLGHIDPRFDGEPALGHVANMALAAGGNKIAGDLAGMPGWLGVIMDSAYPQRSIEGAYGVVCSIGHTHPFVITALALLGVASPGIGVLGSVGDVAALYGVAAGREPLVAERTWQTQAGGPSPMTTPTNAAAGVSTEDVRRAYYGTSGVPMSYWIAEMQMSPSQLIVVDEASDKVYRVPFKISGGQVAFQDPVEVQVEYVDVAATRGTGAFIAWASAADSRAGIEVRGQEVAAGAIKYKKTATDDQAAFTGPTFETYIQGTGPEIEAKMKAYAAWIDPEGDPETKSAYRFGHHLVSSEGVVGAASVKGCQAGIGELNGARGGTTIPDGDKAGVHAHLAHHLTDAGLTPAPLASAPAASAGEGHEGEGEPPAPSTEAAGPHGAFSGSHEHSHAAMGSQGGDQTHTHPHSHSGDASHAHQHASAAGPESGRSADVEFSTEQMAQIRASLGLGEDDELTADALSAWVAERASGQSVNASGRGLPPGIVALDRDEFDRMQQRIARGEQARARQLEDDRERHLDAAVRAGKFGVGRLDHWRRVYNADPEGTREILAGLTPGVVPTSDIGTNGGDEPDAIDTEYEHLFPPQYRRQAAADTPTR